MWRAGLDVSGVAITAVNGLPVAAVAAPAPAPASALAEAPAVQPMLPAWAYPFTPLTGLPSAPAEVDTPRAVASPASVLGLSTDRPVCQQLGLRAPCRSAGMCCTGALHNSLSSADSHSRRVAWRDTGEMQGA